MFMLRRSFYTVKLNREKQGQKMSSFSTQNCFNHLLPGISVNGYKVDLKSGGGLIP